MTHQMLDSGSDELSTLFTSVFTDAEGEIEGKLIGNLAAELSAAIDCQNIFCFASYDKNTLVGAIFFSPLYVDEAIDIFMLAPVAVRTTSQGKGVGQALIQYGIAELQKRSVDVVITYGDPSFYARVGFQPLSEDVVQAPRPLSYPDGWLGQSLTKSDIPQVNKRPACVEAFNNPAYW